MTIQRMRRPIHLDEALLPYLVCRCGYEVGLPVIKDKATYQCRCGLKYDAEGWCEFSEPDFPPFGSRRADTGAREDERRNPLGKDDARTARACHHAPWAVRDMRYALSQGDALLRGAYAAEALV
jgi:hypothetical protein